MIEVSGVRSSCDTVARKPSRTAIASTSGVTSVATTTVPSGYPDSRSTTPEDAMMALWSSSPPTQYTRPATRSPRMALAAI
ncbi:hypothetical protein [Cryobacterium zongtaii]|uniref:hypothetical protein n=1 Tax=Cryobacterium zongtaii TaxID=1259217 RepID=UPI001FCB458E|nr:hypothetical protein [Cryobacterium zongtaii]